MEHNYDYYKLDAYCKSEGLNTDYMLYQMHKKRKRKSVVQRIITVIAALRG